MNLTSKTAGEHDWLEAEAKVAIERMMNRDQSITDVVIAMRSQGRSWNKIRQCFKVVLQGLE